MQQFQKIGLLSIFEFVRQIDLGSREMKIFLGEVFESNLNTFVFSIRNGNIR